LARLAREEPAVHWDRLLFCAKESVYKVWFPLAQCWLGFEDAVLEIDPAGRTFDARVLVPWPRVTTDLFQARSEAATGFPQVLRGRWLVRDGLLLAAIALPARPAGA
jgi:4'-phosphopantetheinyl transferase EntD